MLDIQNQKDNRGIKIQQTGVNNVCMPLIIDDSGSIQTVQANISFTVSLRSDLRGTHMSRLIEILTDWSDKPLAFNNIKSILNEAVDKLQTDSANIHIDFKFFINSTAPVSMRKSLLDLNCFFAGKLDGENQMFTLGVSVPLTTLCPCSKSISQFGAHNQRSLCSVTLNFADTNQYIGIVKLADLIQQQASSPIFSLLKREDEKFVTEAAYNNPKFVEDILRDVVCSVRKIVGVTWFSVECENFESIHNHNAFAYHEEALS